MQILRLRSSSAGWMRKRTGAVRNGICGCLCHIAGEKPDKPNRGNCKTSLERGFVIGVWGRDEPAMQNMDRCG